MHIARMVMVIYEESGGLGPEVLSGTPGRHILGEELEVYERRIVGHTSMFVDSEELSYLGQNL